MTEINLLCRAWMDCEGTYYYCNADGFPYSSIGKVDGETRARRDGFTIDWPNGPGLATLVPIPDPWEDARQLLAQWRAMRDGRRPELDLPPFSFNDALAHCLQELVGAHDRGEL